MIDKLEIISINSLYHKDPEYFQRRVCRYYSEKFHTPLLAVYELPWPFVFQNYLEHVVENNNTKKEIFDLMAEICYPERKVKTGLGEFDNEEAEMQAWIKKIEEEEEEKRKRLVEKSKPPQKEKKVETKSTNDKENPEDEIHMDENLFSHLEDEMDEN